MNRKVQAPHPNALWLPDFNYLEAAQLLKAIGLRKIRRGSTMNWVHVGVPPKAAEEFKPFQASNEGNGGDGGIRTLETGLPRLTV